MVSREEGRNGTLIENYQTKARRIVVNHYNLKIPDDRTDLKLDIPDTYVVWFAKTLQNWKALVSTTIIDGKYYEVTYDGEKHRAYLDVYVKEENVTVADEPWTAPRV